MSAPTLPESNHQSSSPESDDPRSNTAGSNTAGPATTTVSVDIDAASDRVWQSIVTDEGFARWMGEGATIDARPDGTLVAPDVATGEPRRGTISTVEEEHQITFDWWPHAAPAERSHVSIDIEPTPTGTRVTVTETKASAVERAASTALFGTDEHGAWIWRTTLLLVSRTDRVLAVA